MSKIIDYSLVKTSYGANKRYIIPVTRIFKNIRMATYSSKSATFEIKKPKLHKLDKGPPEKGTITAAEARQYLRTMIVIRRMELVAAELYKAQLIKGFCHMYPGQEAIAVGLMTAFQKEDSLITAYRCHPFPYLMGASVLGVLSELAGRATGISRGKGGSMHIYAKRFYGGNGIVGAQVPLGTGVAFAHKYKGDNGVCVTMYGDGAANQGQVYEAFNIAKLHVLPVLYICENNKYGLGTSVDRASACTDFYTRGHYIPGFKVDGQDVVAIKVAAKFALDFVRSGNGPVVMEAETYRYYGHSMSDPGTSYRTREEIEEVRKNRDPIITFKNKVVAAKLITEQDYEDINNKVKAEMQAITEEVKNAPFPGIDELCSDVYALGIEPTVRGPSPTRICKHFNTGHALPK